MTESCSLASEPLSAFQSFVADLEVKQGCEMVSIASWGQGGQGIKGLTLWVGKGMQGHWNVLARLNHGRQVMRSETFVHCLGKLTNHCSSLLNNTAL